MTGGRDTTGWYAFHVAGLEVDRPAVAASWIGEIPDWIAVRIREAVDSP